jgi:hypothetical protein
MKQHLRSTARHEFKSREVDNAHARHLHRGTFQRKVIAALAALSGAIALFFAAYPHDGEGRDA